MNRANARSMVSIVATLALLTIAGARSLHFETGEFPHHPSRTATVATTGPCSLCDQPDCALLLSVAPVAVPVTIAVVPVGSSREQIDCQNRIPHHIRPPPGK